MWFSCLTNSAIFHTRARPQKLESSAASKTTQQLQRRRLGTRYELLANICHDGTPAQGSFRMQKRHPATGRWFELQDLHVWTDEAMPQLVALSETYIQVYQLQED